MDITDALMTASHFHALEKPQRNSDGDTMREAATAIHKLRAERDAALSRAQRMEEALKEYGEHKSHCNEHPFICSCGLTAALTPKAGEGAK